MKSTDQTAVLRVRIEQKAWHYLKEINSLCPDQSDALALTDGCRSYRYTQMFERFEKNAAVFTALGMTCRNRSRVGLIGSTSADTVCALYGLNMVGAEVSVISCFQSFQIRKLIYTIRNEALTDLILTDDYVQPDVFAGLMAQKEALGLRNVIYLHIPIGGKAIEHGLSLMQEQKYAWMWNWVAPYTMDALLAQYGSGSVDYASLDSCDTSFILHTSGTSTGTGKPIPLSDKALNFFGRSYHMLPGLGDLTEKAVCGVSIDLSNVYALANQLHAPLALNAAVVMVPGAAFNPLYYRAVTDTEMSVLFTTPAQLEMWIQLIPAPNFDFSTLRCVVSGGAAMSVRSKKRIRSFLTRHGAKNLRLIDGYGLSELGGACILSTTDPEDASIGYPLPGVEVRLFDEESGVFKGREDAPCTGVLYLRSDAMTCGFLDGQDLVRQEIVEGKRFLCSNDLVSMDETGKITFLGRANRYFLNNDGIKYESGKVEIAFSGQEGIESCGVVPVYLKSIHDNIPMLCVKPLINDDTAEAVVCRALETVFLKDQSLALTNIPLRVLIAEELPRNPNGKIDANRIGRGLVVGRRYAVETDRENEQITGFRLTVVEEHCEDVLHEAANTIIEDIFAEYKDFGCVYNFNQKEDNQMFNFNDAQNFFRNMNQMGSQWMNWNSQMVTAYTNQLFQMTKQMADTMHKQNMEVLEKVNEILQTQANAAAAAASAPVGSEENQ